MTIKIFQGPTLNLVGNLVGTLVGLLSLTAVAAGGEARAAGPPPHAAPKGTGAATNRYLGAHPLAGNPGTGYCYIDVPHVHDFVPDRPAVYQQVGDEYVFTGDPVPFGYEGEKTVFYGHHPVPVAPTANAAPTPPMTFCFLKGPHYHDYAQPEAAGFKQKDNTVFYVGPIPPEVARERLQRERALEIEYQPYVAQRPQVVVSPPPEWQGVVWTPPPPQAVVVAPPQPVVVAAPQVVVAPPIMPTVVVAPPQPGVVIMPPQPHTVVIGAPGPGVIFMGGPGPGPHGHGKGWKKGKGWGKGGHGWGKGGRRW